MGGHFLVALSIERPNRGYLKKSRMAYLKHLFQNEICCNNLYINLCSCNNCNNPTNIAGRVILSILTERPACLPHRLNDGTSIGLQVFLRWCYRLSIWYSLILLLLLFLNTFVKTPTPTQQNTTVGFDMKMTVQTTPPHPLPHKLFRHF